MKTNLKMFVVLVGLVLVSTSRAWAVEQAPLGEGARGRIAQLRALREENPQAFRDAIEQHKGQIKERLKRLREEDPEKFSEIAEKHRRELRGRLEALREKDPQAFGELMERRRAQIEKRAQGLKEHNPERYEEFVRKHVRKLNELEEKHPERFRSFLENHPHLRERLKQAYSDKEGPTSGGSREERIRGLRALKEENPERFERMMQNHPKVRERLKEASLKGRERLHERREGDIGRGEKIERRHDVRGGGDSRPHINHRDVKRPDHSRSPHVKDWARRDHGNRSGDVRPRQNRHAAGGRPRGNRGGAGRGRT
ncbi:MAG: hypothetical protein A3G87_04785 [Omnitrophica bacterium RIFCSPLOWO2_12_FULL_50_11]|nr:MAG: hypothetical protein A3G87_04785 [Omnitrophica bacterium RIFCSPLOWO2_12_FULL_50_11]